MPKSGRTSSALIGALTLFIGSLAFAAPAGAAAPATVTVRVEGLNGTTVVPQAQVTTTTTSIAVGGSTCSGTSAGGALYDAVNGNWTVKYDGTELGYEIDGIKSLRFPPFSEAPDAYWSFWLNNASASTGACGQELSQGDHVVFFAQCDAIGPDCSSKTAPEHFLTSTVPNATVVQQGLPVSVTIGSVNTATGVGETSLPAGVTVSAGAVTVTPSAVGTASLVFSQVGTYSIQAHASNSVPSEPETVCVHNGNDGNCGTPAPAGTQASSSTSSAITQPPYKGAYAVVARSVGITEGQVFPHGHGPRTLTGTVSAHTGLSSVGIELRRKYRARCSAYDGTTARFIAARCGHGSFFKVSSSSSFSYLLPAALGPGRYVLDIEATDSAGNHSALARGSTRTVFDVR